MTPQRVAIVAALDDARAHTTAEQVHDAVLRGGHRVSLATVYNTLSALAAMGELREVHAGRRSAAFDYNVDPHHHVVCDVCGALADLDPGVARGLRLAASQSNGFEVHGVEVVFHGRCRACAAR